jgi:hypothetical protein
LDNRPSCPGTVANRTAEYWIRVMEMLRRGYRPMADEIAGKLKLARFERMRHRITGERRNPSTGAG